MKEASMSEQTQEKATPLEKNLHTIKVSLWAVALAVVFAGAAVSASILFLGKLWADGLRGTGAAQNQAQDQQAQAQQPPANPEEVSFDDDPILGDKSKAKVAIVEFSDYECPFCKMFHQKTSDQIVKNYVDTGKAVMVFRDYPLDFHEPKATEEAQAANCVRKLSNDKKYFEFGRLLFENTQTNGKGLPTGLTTEKLAEKVGIKASDFKQCAQGDTFKDEISQDASYGNQVGVDGTPAFFVGTIEGNKIVNVTRLVGAQPFDTFKKVIDEKLK